MRAFLPPRCPLSEQLCVTIYISSTPSTYSNLIRRASIVSGGTSRLLEYTYTLVVQQSVQQRRIESTSSRVLCYIRIYMHAEQTKRKIGDTLGGRERERSCIEMGRALSKHGRKLSSVSRWHPYEIPAFHPLSDLFCHRGRGPVHPHGINPPLSFSPLILSLFNRPSASPPLSPSLSLCIYMCVIVYRIFYLCST